MEKSNLPFLCVRALIFSKPESVTKSEPVAKPVCVAKVPQPVISPAKEGNAVTTKEATTADDSVFDLIGSDENEANWQNSR